MYLQYTDASSSSALCKNVEPKTLTYIHASTACIHWKFPGGVLCSSSNRKKYEPKPVLCCTGVLFVAYIMHTHHRVLSLSCCHTRAHHKYSHKTLTRSINYSLNQNQHAYCARLRCLSLCSMCRCFCVHAVCCLITCHTWTLLKHMFRMAIFKLAGKTTNIDINIAQHAGNRQSCCIDRFNAGHPDLCCLWINLWILGRLKKMSVLGSLCHLVET